MRTCSPDESGFFSEVFMTTSAPAPRQIKHKIKQTLQRNQNHLETGLRRARDVLVVDVALVAPSLGEPSIFPLIKKPRKYNLSSQDTRLRSLSSLKKTKQNDAPKLKEQKLNRARIEKNVLIRRMDLSEKEWCCK